MKQSRTHWRTARFSPKKTRRSIRGRRDFAVSRDIRRLGKRSKAGARQSAPRARGPARRHTVTLGGKQKRRSDGWMRSAAGFLICQNQEPRLGPAAGVLRQAWFTLDGFATQFAASRLVPRNQAESFTQALARPSGAPCLPKLPLCARFPPRASSRSQPSPSESCGDVRLLRCAPDARIPLRIP